MNKTILCSANPEIVRPLIKELGFEELPPVHGTQPDFVIAHGGDGTFLNAERDWPGVPKLFLRRSRVSPDTARTLPRKALEKIRSTDVSVREFPKIAFYHGRTEAVATSDIIVRNLNPNQALRFCLEKCVGATASDGEIIGDGLVLATPIGARAYYRSITRDVFKSPFGLAFNNTTEPVPPVELQDGFSIDIRILREIGILCLDNLPCFWSLRANETVVVKSHPEKTRILDVLDLYPKASQDRLGF